MHKSALVDSPNLAVVLRDLTHLAIPTYLASNDLARLALYASTYLLDLDLLRLGLYTPTSLPAFRLARLVFTD